MCRGISRGSGLLCLRHLLSSTRIHVNARVFTGIRRIVFLLSQSWFGRLLVMPLRHYAGFPRYLSRKQTLLAGWSVGPARPLKLIRLSDEVLCRGELPHTHHPNH